jgi:hypothetical protein
MSTLRQKVAAAVRPTRECLLLLLASVMFMGHGAVGQTGDLGAQIAAADAKLGANPGQIIVSTSGTISEGEVSLSAGHDLVCTGQSTISLSAGSYLYQNSYTGIRNCIISSTSTPINGEVQSTNTSHVVLDGVTFVGGGNLVYWVGVSDFLISDNNVVSITAFDPATQVAQSGYYLMNCSRGSVNNLTVTGFVFPPGPASYPAILDLSLSHHITINNISINNVDASFDFGGSGIQINGSSHITINGGAITHNAKMDGITSESFGPTGPSYDINIIGINASYNGGQGGNTKAPLTLGDGIDVINTGRVRISNCTILGSGYAGNQQPAIWLFIDDDVLVADCNLSDGSTAGLAIAGTPNVRLLNNTISRNQASGTFAEFQAGTATSVGSTVTFVSGVTGGFGLAWRPGTPFILDGITYQIASVTDSGHIVLATSPPTQPSPVNWAVNATNVQIIGDVIEDNGLGEFGGQTQVGIDWADATTGIISGVTATNTGIGAQLYGLELDNKATAVLYDDNFSGNLKGGDGIYADLAEAWPSSLSFPNQGVGTATPAQTVTLDAGAVAVQNLLIQVSGDFSETNNCGTQLPGYGICQVQLIFTPAKAGTLSGTLTITAETPNAPQTVSLAGTGLPQGLGLSIATGGSSAATVAAGTTAKYSLSIGGAGMSGTASLSCTGAPTAATCNLPATEVISATQATAFTVSVTTSAPTMGALRPIDHRLSSWLWALSAMGWVVLPAVGRKRQSARRYRLWLPLFLLMFLCSCGGSGESLGSAKSYILTVTAKIGSTSQQVPLNLVVQSTK